MDLRRRFEPSARSVLAQFVRAASAMCAAQRLDLKAAEEGKITWVQYFAMWGAPAL